LCLFLSYEINFIHPVGGLPKIQSDKANYYIYLPATFIYHWDPNKISLGLEKKCNGFIVDRKDKKIKTKMTYGVALLWMPFFLVTHYIAIHWNLQPDGFSDFYERMTVIPGVFYLILGLFFLRRFLRNYFPRWVSYVTIILVFAGTNLYYYGIDDGLMSHVNSFFLFSLFLYLLKKFIDTKNAAWGLIIGLSIVFSLAVLIRPTNILLLTWVIFLDVRTRKDIGERLRLIFRPRLIIIFIITAFIVFLPQFIYWKYLSGHFIWYSYAGETFSNWNHPRLLQVWFSTLNGLFLYTPLALFFVVGMIMMIKEKATNGIFLGISFLLVSYIFSSWYSWFFGGSFGYRPMVEYYALFSLPFAFFIENLWGFKNLYVKSVLICLIFFFVNYNIRATYHQRWNVYSTWSWDDYLIYMQSSEMYSFPWNSYTYKQDFENIGELEELPLSTCAHSLNQAGYVDKSLVQNRIFSKCINDIFVRPIKHIDMEFWINPGKNLKTDARLICKIEDPSKNTKYDKEINFDDYLSKPKNWNKISTTFEIPEWIDRADILSFTVRNSAKKDTIYFDDLKLKFE
jgi:hypothetical protein